MSQHPDFPRFFAPGLVTVLGLAFLAGCDGAGGSSQVRGGGGGPGTSSPGIDFELRRDLALGPGFLGDVVWTDLDGDGRLDLIQSHFQPERLTVALGRADGSFELRQELPTQGGAWRLAVGDLDGDGRRDVAVLSLDKGGIAPRGVEFWLQAADGTLGSHFALSLPFQPIDLAALPASGRTAGAGPPEPGALWIADRDGERLVRFAFVPGLGLVQDEELPSAAAGLTGGPVGVAVLDRRGDGWLDLVVAESRVAGGAPDRVLVHEGSPGGLGPAEVVLGTAFGPIVRGLGDADGDGLADLAVTQLGSARAYLLFGDAGGFRTPLAVDVAGPATALALGDLDGDGLAELVAALFTRDAVLVRPGIGPLAWGQPRYLNAGFQPRGLAVAALGGATAPSVLCGNARDVSIFAPLDPSGVAGPPGELRGARGWPTGSEGPITVDAADLDQDGDQDVVTMTAKQTSLVFLAGDGAGGLSVASLVPLVPSPDENFGHVVIADVDGDGLLDVTATVLQADELRLFRNTGTVGGFGEAAPADRHPTGSRPTGLDLGDLDRDGFLDAIIGNAGDRDVQVLFGTAGGDFVSRPAFPPVAVGARPADIACADLDRDGDLDVVLATGGEGTPATLVVLAGDGVGGLVPFATHGIDTLSGSVELGDFDEDGLLDVVVAQPGVAFDELFLFRNRGGLVLVPERLRVGPDPHAVLVRDLDRDGHLDLAVVSGTSDLAYLLGDGTGAFPLENRGPDAPGDLALPFRTQQSTFADLDGDGRAELLCVGAELPFVWTARNRSVFETP